MKHRTILAISLALAFAMLLSAGCITQSKELGCCVKANATKDGKCLWFNMSNDAFVNMYAHTIGKCNQSTQLCNVTMDSVDYDIPFCTNDNITQCIKPDCLVMACGDFTYRPQIAPGAASAEEAANSPPATNGSGGAQGLYNAQCRFLPMDSKFEARMKTSKSAINDFRFGIGQDFDEYDYYHYYFPISDKYCIINPTGTIDRYMNYLQPGPSGTYVAYDPTKMSVDCTTDAAPAPPASIAPTPSILPASSSGTTALKNITLSQALSFNPSFIIDRDSYKYIDYLGYALTLHERLSKSGAVTGVDWPDSLSRLNKSADYYYEKLDKSFYRKTLSTSYIPEFYNATVGRAPFECDQQAYECLSGNCVNDFYNRGVNVVTDSSGQDTYVTTDCKNAKTVTGQGVVVCYPTISANNNGGTANLGYASVTYRPWQMVLATEDYSQSQLTNKQADLAYAKSGKTIPECIFKDNHNKCQLDWIWNHFFDFSTTNFANWWHSGQPFYNTGSTSELFGAPATVKLLPADFSIYWNGTDTISSVDTTGAYPPAGQIVFFDNQNIQYDGQTIVGYAVADPGQFEQTYFAKSCIFATQTTVEDFYFSPCQGDVCGYDKTRLGCQTQCENTCPAAAHYDTSTDTYYRGQSTTLSRCVRYCDDLINATPDPSNPYNTPYPPSPCNYTVTLTPAANSFIKVDLSGTGQDFRDNYQKLLTAFEPLYNDTMDSYTTSTEWGNKCGQWNSVDINDLLFASMPWISEYKKNLSHWADSSTTWIDHGEADVLNGPGQNFFRDKDNIYEQPTSNTPLFASNTLCNLQKTSARAVGIGQSADDWGAITYKALLPETVYLLKGTTDSSGNMKVGRCNIADGSTLPQIKTFGWCEPCTLATLAYQKVTAGTKSVTRENRVAIPSAEQELSPWASPTTICTPQQGSGNITTSCSSATITGIGDYSGLFIYHQFSTGSGWGDDWTTTYDVTQEGAPRTDQDPALIKERMGNYLKSGIMPVIDISDDSNWNLTAPYVTERFTNSSGTQDTSEYVEYDFQRLLGNGGAIVVVVDNFDSSKASLSRSRILNRTTAVRASCSRCLTAVRVPGGSVGFYKYNTSLSQLFGVDPRVKINVDMIVTDYDTRDYANGGALNPILLPIHQALVAVYGLSSTTPDFRASFLLSDMESYGRLALNYSKPVIITDFTVVHDNLWNDTTYGPLFDSLVSNEDELVKSGILGIIYQPVRSNIILDPTQTEGLVSRYPPLAGSKTQKFCALEEAMNKMAGTNPYATFVQVYTVPSVNCTICSSLELAEGTCSKTCDNGVSCTLPSGLTEEQKSSYKCPDDTVVEPCTPCNRTNSVYACSKSYGNGSVVPQPGVSSSVINSDAYQDVMSGMSKPNKCCLSDVNGNYTYFKKMYYTSVTAPDVFSSTGDPNQDCGIGTGNSLTQLGGFCGITLPVKNFDINCVKQ